MPAVSRALLIAAPYGELEGPERDVQDMARVLGDRGFQLTRCCGPDATRDGILGAWDKLIRETTRDDVIVIFYSGHGSFLSSQSNDNTHQRAETDRPWYYQFIIPMDFNPKSTEFTGILEIELSQRLLRTTAITHNVTVILGCCHSGRIVRDPDLGAEARFKKLPPLRHEAAYQHARALEQQGKLQGKTFAQGNLYAVQLAAAAPWEEAAEYPDRYGEYRGLFTTALTQAIHDARGQEVSWKTVIAYVTELVHARCSRQKPWIRGPYTRFLFSLDGRGSGVLPVKLNDSTAIIRAGRVGGVRVDNVYAVMPPGSERAETHRQIARAIVTHVEAFQSCAKLEFNETRSETTTPVPADGLALGFITTEALYKWPVRCPEALPALRVAIERSRFLRIVENDNESSLIEFCLEDGAVAMRNGSSMVVGIRRRASAEPTTSDIAHVLRGAEIFARARQFLTIQSTGNESPDTHVLSAFQTNVYLVENGTRSRLIQPTGEDMITEQQRISIQLKNDSDLSLYISVFSVEVTG
jgi:hypothetical protein